MAFQSKTNYFPVLTANIVCVSNSDGHSQSVAKATDEYGSYIAHTEYGSTYAPSNSYVVQSDISASAGDVKLCSVFNDTGIGSVVLNSVTINTQAGQAPTLDFSGESVESGASATCTYSIPAFNLALSHHAQILFDAFSVTGSGCYLQSSTATCQATITKAEKDGDCLAHDVSQARIDVTANITQTGSTEPTLSAGTGWFVSSPLACDNPDADYPSWSATVTKYLTRD